MRRRLAKRRGGLRLASKCQFANIEVATVQVSYSKLLNEVPGFDGVTCDDLGIGGAHVVLAGPQPVDEVWANCMQSKQYANVTPGTYQATITLLDTSMNPLTNAVTTQMTDVEKGPVTALNINFMQSDFVKQDYTGQLDIDAQWGAANMRCNDASVTMESVTLKDSTGALVTSPMATDDGLKLDGTFGACFTASGTAPQRVTPLTWGHYTVTLQGKTNAGMTFCQAFQVFVPPGSDPAKTCSWSTRTIRRPTPASARKRQRDAQRKKALSSSSAGLPRGV